MRQRWICNCFAEAGNTRPAVGDNTSLPYLFLAADQEGFGQVKGRDSQGSVPDK